MAQNKTIFGYITDMVRQAIGARIDYLAAYPATVAGVNADGSVDLVPDSLAAPQLKHVPIRSGIPDVTIGAAIGARAFLWFAEGMPTAPFATLFDAGPTPATPTLTFGGTATPQPVARTTDNVNVGLSLVITGGTPPGPWALSIVYTPPIGAPIVTMSVAGTGAFVPGIIPLLAGTITGPGNPKVLA